MKILQGHGRTLSGRIVLFLTLFGIALLMQLVLWRYQSTRILTPTQERIETIQTISQFLDGTGTCLTALEDYRWDYGDAATLTEIVERYRSAAQAQLQSIHAEPGTASEAYCLLDGAVETSFSYFSDRADQIAQALRQDNSAAAAQIYYGKTALCGSYLQQYTRELLERAILDNHDALSALYATNDRLQLLQLVTMLLSVVATALLVVSLYFLLRSVVQLSRASLQISQGELDIPDVDDSRQDEMGHLAGTFNEMKHSMRQQMQLLQEKNEMARELYTKETEALALQNLIEAGKLQLLRSQIHPHFLFNTLNLISYNARQEGAEKTGTLIASLSRLFRYSLGSNAAEVPLAKEKQIVDDYYSLYHARFGDRIRLKWDIDPALDITETMIPSFLIQPLVENAIQHGIAPKEEGGCVEIDVRAADGLLQITVSDDGVGMSEEALERLHSQLQSFSLTGEHIGLYNVAARLKLSGRSDGLEIRSAAGAGTSASMRLPLVIAEEKEETEDE
ncbi:MAG: sensor histidine kinase [Oscillospiraceae bacterium]|nr:sensor histidine kinase [Oscillospiraceae bacterium]